MFVGNNGVCVVLLELEWGLVTPWSTNEGDSLGLISFDTVWVLLNEETK